MYLLYTGAMLTSSSLTPYSEAWNQRRISSFFNGNVKQETIIDLNYFLFMHHFDKFLKAC